MKNEAQAEPQMRDIFIAAAGITMLIGLAGIACSSTSPMTKAVVFAASAFYTYSEKDFRWRPKVGPGVCIALVVAAVFGVAASTGLIPRSAKESDDRSPFQKQMDKDLDKLMNPW